MEIKLSYAWIIACILQLLGVLIPTFLFPNLGIVLILCLILKELIKGNRINEMNTIASIKATRFLKEKIGEK